MAARLGERIQKLEAGAGDPAYCQCKPTRLHIAWENDEQDLGAPVCAACGLPVLVIRVQYEQGVQDAGATSENLAARAG